MSTLNVSSLYQAHQSWLQNWLTKKTGCRFDAADITQDTFVRLLSSPPNDNLQQPRAYLTKIAHGLMVNHLRRKDLERAYLESLADQPEALTKSPEYHSQLIETLHELDRMLRGLPFKVRNAFLMSQLEGLKYAEIAERLNVSVSMVKKYMLQAVQHCMKIERPDN